MRGRSLRLPKRGLFASIGAIALIVTLLLAISTYEEPSPTGELDVAAEQPAMR